MTRCNLSINTRSKLNDVTGYKQERVVSDPKKRVTEFNRNLYIWLMMAYKTYFFSTDLYIGSCSTKNCHTLLTYNTMLLFNEHEITVLSIVYAGA